MRSHVQECPVAVGCSCGRPPHRDDCPLRKPCICKELLSAGARGYESGYGDARKIFEVPTGVWDEESYDSGYWEGYEQGYDSALANHICETTYFNQHGQGENP